MPPPYGMMPGYGPPPGYPAYPYPPHPQMMAMMPPHAATQGGFFYPPPPHYPNHMLPPQHQQMATAAATHAAANSTQGFAHIKLQNLIQTNKDSGGDETMAATSKKTDGDPDDERSGPGATTGTIAKTEAGEGMFGADIELDSLTDSDDHDDDHHHRKRDKGDG